MKSKELKASRKSISATSSELGNNHMITHEAMMDHLFGAPASPTRNAYEQGFEAFKLGAMIKDLRERQHLTQEQLAIKCSTTKSYISRIENNASDIRLSTLMRIINEGLGAKLTLHLA
jgi:HTH-type transcriptional regulator/antitoxin HipB